MNKLLKVAVIVAAMGTGQCYATLTGTLGSYDLYTGGGYQGDGTPALGTFNSSGTAAWQAAALPAAAGLSALTPGGIETASGFDAWYPLGYVNFSARIITDFVAPSAGSYTFGTYSDDGSALYVDGTLVVNNLGEHPPTFTSATASLTPGLHQLLVTYFEGQPLIQANLTAYADSALVPVPEPSTYLAGVLMLLPFAFRGVRSLRSRKSS
jgi:PA14 domain